MIRQFLGYRFIRIDKIDIRILSVFNILVIIPYLLDFISIDYKFIQVSKLLAGFFGLYVVIGTPLGLRFRNFNFVFLWLIPCLILLRFSQDYLNYWPLVSFIYYQIVRIIFWIKYKLEFIPLWVGKGGIDGRFSKLENRRSKYTDKKYMYVTFWGGIILMILTIICDGLRII